MSTTYEVAPGVKVDAQYFRMGDQMFLDLVIHTQWGPVAARLQADADTLRKALVGLRKQYGAGLYDFVAEKPPWVQGLYNSNGSPRSLSRVGHVLVPPHKTTVGTHSIRQLDGAVLLRRTS